MIGAAHLTLSIMFRDTVKEDEIGGACGTCWESGKT